MLRLLPLLGVSLLFIASQLFWFRHIGRLGARWIRKPLCRKALAAAGLALYALLLAYNLGWIKPGPTPVHLTLRAALLEAPLRWWVLSCLLGVVVASLLWLADLIIRVTLWVVQRLGRRDAAQLQSPARRRFLERTALAVSSAPFVACAWGFFYSRLNLETTYQRIKLRRLPKGFDGFRIAQLSDIHIGPFMPAEEIRKYVHIANRMKPDLIVLTGDFVTWDPETQGAVVKELAALKAPFGVFGCLGNHEIYTGTEDSITRLFAAEGVRILRQERAPIVAHGDELNLVGVDFQTLRRVGWRGYAFLRPYLWGAERLVAPHVPNILLSHNPNSFDRAAELGIDLTLAGHTHGGQVAVEFVHRNISPGKLVTDYVKGWFEKSGSQLYVNRGIGTIGVPIRLNAPPEITLFELVREA